MWSGAGSAPWWIEFLSRHKRLLLCKRAMKIRMNYYAMFREAAGRGEEVVELDSGGAPDLFDLLKSKYEFSMCRSHVRLALNDEFVDWDTSLKEGDSVVFIPPVAGG